MHLEGGPMGRRALAERLEVDPGVLVGILNDLEGEGPAERRRDPADRRRHSVAILAGLPAAERELLRGLLDRVSTSAEDFESGEQPPVRTGPSRAANPSPRPVPPAPPGRGRSVPPSRGPRRRSSPRPRPGPAARRA